MPSQPLASFTMTAGLRVYRTDANFSGKLLNFPNVQFLTRVDAYLVDATKEWWIELCRSGTGVEALTEAPIWTVGISPTVLPTTSEADRAAMNNTTTFWQPLECQGQVQIQFRHTAPYPNGTVLVPTGNVVVQLESFPSTYSSYEF